MHETLTSLRELLTPTTSWTKNHHARRADGTITHGSDREAVCFCLLGGLDHLVGYGTKVYLQTRDFLNRLSGVYVAQFNDDPQTTHQDVLALLDRAIAATSAAAL